MCWEMMKSVFDFVVETPSKVYLIEVNFYSGGGSKLNEVARSYSDIAPKINSVEGFEFVLDYRWYRLEICKEQIARGIRNYPKCV